MSVNWQLHVARVEAMYSNIRNIGKTQGMAHGTLIATTYRTLWIKYQTWFKKAQPTFRKRAPVIATAGLIWTALPICIIMSLTAALAINKPINTTNVSLQQADCLATSTAAHWPPTNWWNISVQWMTASNWRSSNTARHITCRDVQYTIKQFFYNCNSNGLPRLSQHLLCRCNQKNSHTRQKSNSDYLSWLDLFTIICQRY